MTFSTRERLHKSRFLFLKLWLIFNVLPCLFGFLLSVLVEISCWAIVSICVSNCQRFSPEELFFTWFAFWDEFRTTSGGMKKKIPLDKFAGRWRWRSYLVADVGFSTSRYRRFFVFAVEISNALFLRSPALPMQLKVQVKQTREISLRSFPIY